MKEGVVVGAGLIVGGVMTPGVMNGDPARFLSTFLGLVAASILPTISLILATMTPGGRSILAINELQKELEAAVNDLFMLLLGVGIVFCALFTLSVPSPFILKDVIYLNKEILPRAGQAMVVGGSALILARAWHIPVILRRSLKIRHEIAVDEARKKTLENALKVPSSADLFPRHPEFGKTVKLSDLPPS